MADSDLYKQLYTLFEQNVFFGDQLDDREFVALLAPGQFVSTNLKKTSADDEFNLFQLTDKALDSTYLWHPMISTVSGLYGEIVEFAALPDKEEDQALIKRLADQLAEWQANYDAFKQAYDDADADWRKAMAQDPVDENLVIEMEKKRAAALRNWENPNKGRKKQYDETLGELNQHLAGNPREFWETHVRQPFVDRRRDSTRGQFYDTVVNPHPSSWPTAGWAAQHIDVKSVWSRDYSRSTSFSAGASVGFGFWSAGGSYSRNTQATEKQSKVKQFSIDMEILRVNITRPWLYQDLFGRRYWAWKKSHENLLITDGGNLPIDRPKGRRGMPVLPTVFFVARNVRLQANWSNEDKKTWDEQIHAGASFGWGPFSASGSYSESTSEKTYTGKFDGAVITIEQPQIIAVGGLFPPKSPDPDPGLSWSKKVGEQPWLSPPQE